ncbi:hypothetical protein N7481_004752 [Penicillium waksmanii]|uniref:uncharacterized protein n=1 Tax=Penicillium waksmanii TaxID=69791 RepID=UPI002548AE82|nr:uncharacterized protein N7481_004752 [Penicillium waksmanii]KAJ5989542.1 hypothetical protein N7481_004752 [Penicillium waksmanii]
MQLPSSFGLLRLSLGITVALSTFGGAFPHGATSAAKNVSTDCNRACLSNIVDQFLESVVKHDPFSLPLASVYKATENSHAAALTMMTLWRTVTKVTKPNLLAIDSKQGTVYFSLDINEGGIKNILRTRLKVVNRKITELEIFVNRYRGEHGFSFSAEELPSNYAVLMSPPANRTKASRADLTSLSEALFATSSDFEVAVSDTCQFTEIGWKVIDTGVYANGTTDPLGCSWPDAHPTDDKARVALVIDEELGFVVTSGMIPGIIYPYQNVSAFIPDAMPTAQEAQDVWYAYAQAQGDGPLVAPAAGMGETLEVLQYYNDELQAMQINVYLNAPNATSLWL